MLLLEAMAAHAHNLLVLTYSSQPSVADFLRRIAHAAGFDSHAASSPAELKAVATRLRPDVVLYEIGFPFTDQWEQFTQLRREAALQHLPFVLTTPDASETLRRIGVHALELFRKPDDLSEIRHAVLTAVTSAA